MNAKILTKLTVNLDYITDEPSIENLIYKYYKGHFDSDTAKMMTRQYIEALQNKINQLKA